MPPHGCPRTGAPISRNVLQRLLPSSFLAVVGDPVVLQAPTPQSGPSRASINWRIVARIVSTVSGLVRSAQCSSTRRPAVLPIGRTARPRAVSRTNRARPDLGRRGQPVWHDVLPTAVPASASCPAPVTPVTGSRCPGRSESGPVGAGCGFVTSAPGVTTSSKDGVPLPHNSRHRQPTGSVSPLA